MVRDILDNEGNVIGEVSLPDDATEQQWTAAISAYITPPEVLHDVTARQIRQALVLSGITMANVEDTIALLPEPTRSLAQIEWEYSNMFERNRPLTMQLAALFGLTSEQVDNIWRLAASLP